MVLRPRSYLEDLTPYVPGRSYESDVMKGVYLASNEGALGMSQKALLAYHEGALTLDRYPDGSSLRLRQALAQHYKLDMGRIMCGNGSDELIQLLMLGYVGEGDDILYSEYGFLMYRISAGVVGARAIGVPEQDLKTDIQAILDHVTPRTRMVVLANPNNPTGSYLNETELYFLREHLREDILLVIDAAYSEFVDRRDYSNGVSLVGETGNVVMLRTFSKIYGLAGLRLGWLYGGLEVVELLGRIRLPFSVNGVVQSVGIAALSDVQHIERAYEYNKRNRVWLEGELGGLGWEVYPSVANFLLVSFGGIQEAQGVYRFLRDRGILVRPMDGYGLSECLRITIGSREDLEKLVCELRTYGEV